MSATAVRAARSPLAWRREVLLFVGAYVAYSLARGAATGSLETAVANARLIVQLQAEIGIGIERTVQEHLIGQPVMWLFNRLYLIAQFAVLPAGLVWVYRRRPTLYPRLRTTVLATWLIALPVYVLFPTAPPRLANIGVLDTVSEQTSFALDSPLVMAFYNPVAAVPSLHAGFAFAIGLGIAAATTAPWLRLAGLAWGPVVAVVVIATGNHFVLDIAIGMVAVLLGYGVALLLHRSPEVAAVAPGTPRPPLRESLRVALVCPYDWQRPGGVRTHVAGLAAELRSRGHHVDVIAAGHPSGSSAGLVLVGAPTPVRANGSVARVALGPAAWRRTRRAIAAGGYDVVHVHEPAVPLIARAAARWRSGPVVATFHMYDPRARAYRLLGPFVRRPLRALASGIAVSAAAGACASRVYPVDEVIPNGVRIPRDGRPHRPATRSILFVGRHEPRKGLPVLLDALSHLPPDIRLDLVGVEAAEIAAAASPEQLGRITAHGRVDDARLRVLLRRTDVLCAPSLGGESFGLVLAEAMAEGIPVVASEIPGYRDVLRACGRLVPPGDALALAEALEEMLSDATLRRRLGDDARRAVRPFEWAAVCDRIEGHYRRAISRQQAAMPAGAPGAPAVVPAAAHAMGDPVPSRRGDSNP
jgi:glycosyltransferase involved in cell wall biosynthesis